MKIENLYKILIVVIALMPFFAPITLSDFLFYADPSILKASWGIFGSLLILLLWQKSAQQTQVQKLVVKKSNLYLPILLFILWCLVSILWSANVHLSIVTLIKYSSFALIFFLVFNLFTSTNKINNLLHYLVVSMMLVSMIGLLQYYFPNSTFVQTLFGQTHVPASTFVNKNMAGHFMVMTLPLSFIFIFMGRSKEPSMLLLYTVATFLGSWYVLNIAARQVYVAIFSELIILLLFFILDFYSNKSQSLLSKLTLKKYKLISIIGLFISLFVASNITPNGFNLDSGLKSERLSKITLKDGQSRLPMWVNTLEMIKDSPIHGVGLGQWAENYAFYYDKTVKDTTFNDYKKAQRAHNDYIEMLASVGIVGFSLLLWIFSIIVKNIWIILTNPDNDKRFLVLALSLGLVGFSVEAFFSFPIWSYLPGFLTMVFVAILHTISKTNDYFKLSKKGLYTTFTLTGFIFFFFLYYFYNLLSAENLYQKAAMAHDSGNFSLANTLNQKSLNYIDTSKKYYKQSGFHLIKTKQYQKAIVLLEKAHKIAPYDLFTLSGLSMAFQKTGLVNKHKVILYKILEIDPRNVRALEALVEVLFIEKDFVEANLHYKKLKESFEYFKGRAGFGPYHSSIVMLSLKVGDPKYASYIYSDLVSRQPTAINYSVYGVIEYQRLGNKKKAKSLFLKAIELDAAIEIPEEIKQDLDL